MFGMFGMFGRHAVIAALAAAACVAARGQASAEEPAPLTLADCARLATESPSPVQIAADDAAIAERSVEVARAALYPQTAASAGFVYNSPLGGAPGVQSFVSLDGVRVYNALVTAVQELDTSGRLRASVDRARADEDAAAARLALSRRDLRRAVATAYYQLLLQRHLVRVASDALEEARSFERRTELLFGRGEAARADVVKAEAQVAFLEQTLAASRLEARLRNQELASFWTTSVDAPLSVEDVLDEPLPAPPPELAKAMEEGEAPYLRRPELNLLDAERRGWLADARAARSELLPQASLVVQYGINSQRFDFSNDGIAAFVNVSLPVFDWHRIRSSARALELRARQVETDRSVRERAFSLELQRALASVRMVREQIATTRRQVELSRENLRLSRIRYEGGEGLALDVVVAQDQLTLASSNYYSTVARYLTSLVELEVASGR